MKTQDIQQAIPVIKGPKGASQVSHRHARVLIAEDDCSFRDMLLMAFEQEGCDVVAVADGASLLDVLATSLHPKSDIKPFDLVISDIRMPGWGGLVALENLPRSPLAPPVVVITAFGSDELHAQAKRAGAVAVLDKPFDIAELTALSRRVISRHV
jgi:CheY-like chemotaxis protein